MVLKLGSIKAQGFGGLEVRRFGLKKHIYFPTTKGSMNACVELVGFIASNKVKDH